MKKFALLAVLFCASVVAQTTQPVEGDWEGVLHTGGPDLRLVLHIKTVSDRLTATLDSVDQGALGIPTGEVTFTAPRLLVTVPLVNGGLDAKLSADGKTLTGDWTQGLALPITLKRVVAAPAVAEVATVASAPVATDQLKAVLDRDLAAFLQANPKSGISIGLMDHGKRTVLAFGTAKPDSLFEIGSITKTFTATILAQMVQQGVVKLSDPVRSLLDAKELPSPGEKEIRLIDLATQHSGLPRMPPDFAPGNRMNPYADYDGKRLYSTVRLTTLRMADNAPYGYSNYGFGLLGFALARKAGTSYEELLHKQVLDPLGMRDTFVTIGPAQQARFIRGYQATWSPAHSWELNALSGAGAIRSTANDMLTYAQANMHPDALPACASGPCSTLGEAIHLAQQRRASLPNPEIGIGLAWNMRDGNGRLWHNGGTGGYSSLLTLDPRNDRAIIVLSNREDARADKPQMTEQLAAHIFALLNGKATKAFVY